MNPILADVRRLLAYLAACALAGLALAVLLCTGGPAATWGDAVAFAVPPALVFGFVALSAYHVCRSLPHDRRRAAAVALRFGTASAVAGAAWLGLGLTWNAAGGLGPSGRPFVAMAPAAWALFALAGAGLYLLSLLAHDVLVALESVHEAARREAESRVLARDAELRLLRTQIDPHFLFNSLNSISALTAIDPEEARAMTIDLAQFFRRTLALGGRDRVPLREELSLCGHFLAIERRRHGDRLRAELRVPEDAQGCLLPPMTLQPLLENAIKHGARGGPIELDAAVRDGWLHLSVANPVAADGDDAAAAAPAGAVAGLGLGLANIGARLSMLHGGRARLSTRCEAGRHVVEIALPADQAPVAATAPSPSPARGPASPETER